MADSIVRISIFFRFDFHSSILNSASAQKKMSIKAAARKELHLEAGNARRDV